MDPNSGKLYPSLAAAQEAGVDDAVEIRGSEEAIRKIASKVAAAEERKTRPRKVPHGSRHVHDMRASSEPGVLKCASCVFRCEDSSKVISMVKSRTDLHMIVTKGSPEDLKAVFRG
jgi:hypothetical protein